MKKKKQQQSGLRPKIRSRRQAFSLVEVLFSFILISLSVVSIYSIYTAVAKSTVQLEKSIARSRDELLRTRRIRGYLMNIITNRTTFQGKGAAKPFFYVEGSNNSPNFQVYACLNNGTDPITALSNEVIGRFYIDPEGSFYLTITSHPLRKKAFHPAEADIKLWEHVSSILWEFSSWPTAKSENKNPDAELSHKPPNGFWTQSWKKEWIYTPPGLIRLTIFYTDPQSNNPSEATITIVLPSSIQPMELGK